MGINLDDPPLYDPLTKASRDHMSNIWTSWFATFFQTVIQKFIFWQVVTTSQRMQVTNGYFANGAGPLTLTLPLTSDIGDELDVYAMNANGWIIAQNAGQQIQVRNTTTTLGTGGSLASTAIGDTARLICSVTNTNWVLISHEGTLAVV